MGGWLLLLFTLLIWEGAGDRGAPGFVWGRLRVMLCSGQVAVALERGYSKIWGGWIKLK